MTSDMFEAARILVEASLAPGLSEIEMKAQLCERFYRREVDVEAFKRGLHDRRLRDLRAHFIRFGEFPASTTAIELVELAVADSGFFKDVAARLREYPPAAEP